MKKIFICIFIYVPFIIMIYQNILHPFSYNDKDEWKQKRQSISINAVPSYSVIFPPLADNLLYNVDTFTSIAQINFDDYLTFFDYVDTEGSFWYVPNISYTFYLYKGIGLEVSAGLQHLEYTLTITPENALILATNHAQVPNLPGNIGDIASLLAGDTVFKGSFYYLPITIGVKLLSGKNGEFVNTIRFGIETVIYDIVTQNGLTGFKTKRSTIDPTFYVSYELGWTIDLFPKKDWKVRTYLDISLFEIGYYITSSMSGVYGDVREGVGFFGSGFVDITKFLPLWETFPAAVDFVTSLKLSLFPRIGVTIRF
ncbi:hypothetical protein R4J18_06570 [Brachyspira pilosicoli]|uniref:hypothetical protein n=1 Tax=Brachyspira pilosicoli TaxID=52584 RepID=UPI0030049006